MKLLIMLFSPVPCHFLPLNPNYLPPSSTIHTVEHPQPVFLPRCDNDQVPNPNNIASKITVLYILILKFLETKGNRTVAGIPLIQSALDLFCNAILTCSCNFHYLNFATISVDLLAVFVFRFLLLACTRDIKLLH